MGFSNNPTSESQTALGGASGTGNGDGRADLPDEGGCVALAGEFVTQRSVRVDAGVVCRVTLRVDDETTVHVVLPVDFAGERFDLRTGARYHVTGTVVRSPTVLSRVDAECPDCGETLRRAGAVDEDEAVRAALPALGVDASFVRCESFQRVGDASARQVDDWTPKEKRGARDVGGYVCPTCRTSYATFELSWSDGRADADARVQEGEPVGDQSVPSLQSVQSAPMESLGLATGGARDATNFRENVESGFVPQLDALAFEGLFYDYRFPTKRPGDEESDARAGGSETGLFRPTYARAASRNPVTGETERYLSVGLDSSLDAESFERPPLDVVAVLDVSGSMSAPFDEYYYDASGTRRRVDRDGTAQTKMAAARDSLCALTKQLDADDRLGVVLFDHRAHVAKPLRAVGETDMEPIRRHVRRIQSDGGTDLSAGFRAGRDLLATAADGDVDCVAGDGDGSDRDGSDGSGVEGGANDASDRERRLVFLTDAMPNTGLTDADRLVDMVGDAAEDGIHTTFVGMGLDENAALMDRLSAVRGANHYFVHSAAEFERRLGEEFDCLVSPLVYDLTLSIDAPGHEVAAVYGAPGADASDGTLLNVTTLFPAPTADGASRGGVILARLHPTGGEGIGSETRDATDGGAAPVELHLSWTEGDGVTRETSVEVDLPEADHYDDVGIRKAVALARYGRMLREWATWARRGADAVADDWRAPTRTEHERGSVPIRVSEAYAQVFETLRTYLEDEREAVGDESLDRELAVLDALLTTAGREDR